MSAGKPAIALGVTMVAILPALSPDTQALMVSAEEGG